MWSSPVVAHQPQGLTCWEMLFCSPQPYRVAIGVPIAFLLKLEPVCHSNLTLSRSTELQHFLFLDIFSLLVFSHHSLQTLEMIVWENPRSITISKKLKPACLAPATMPPPHEGAVVQVFLNIMAGNVTFLYVFYALIPSISFYSSQIWLRSSRVKI